MLLRRKMANTMRDWSAISRVTAAPTDRAARSCRRAARVAPPPSPPAPRPARPALSLFVPTAPPRRGQGMPMSQTRSLAPPSSSHASGDTRSLGYVQPIGEMKKTKKSIVDSASSIASSPSPLPPFYSVRVETRERRPRQGRLPPGPPHRRHAANDLGTQSVLIT